MENFSACFFSNYGAALAIATLIFIITIWATAKRWINFPVTLLLLLFSLISGFIIANNDILRQSFSGVSAPSDKEMEVKMSQLQEQSLKAIDSIKLDIELIKHEVATLSKELDAMQKRSASP